MIFGGIMKSMQNQGFGGILGNSPMDAGQGGLGLFWGQILGAVRLRQFAAAAISPRQASRVAGS